MFKKRPEQRGYRMPVYVDDYLFPATVPNGARSVSGKWSHLIAIAYCTHN